ncbi:MAG: hypothetical protein ACMVP2_21915 [Imperialibacter sp.]|uniref:hypothetical protein n=1 Tax=Imperialibacter sp. TaxID=2038411 RepID=UPI003A88A741
MESGLLIGFLLASASIVIGAFLGVLGNWLISEYNKSGWVSVFYMIGVLTLLFPVGTAFFYWEEISNWLGLLAATLSVSASIGLMIFMRTKIRTKNIYKSDEVDPIMNRFTDDADNTEIKLFGGDLSFFGESERKINENSQYLKLKARGFNVIQILCENPTRNETKFRYGKIITDLPKAELRFYDPKDADLRIRGRIAKMGGSDRLVIFDKIESKLYKVIQTDTANSNGVLYNSIWNLIWELAIRPTPAELDEYRKLYQG